MNEHERAFVEALIVYFTYKVIRLREDPPKATRDQICQLLKDRHWIVVDNKQYERLKAKYITRPGKPASRFELLVQTAEGRQGVPSEFRPTGLLRLLPAGAPASPQERSSGSGVDQGVCEPGSLATGLIAPSEVVFLCPSSMQQENAHERLA